MTIALQALSLVEQRGAGPSSLLHTTLEGGTDGVSECNMDVKSTYMDSYVASNGSCFVVTWTVLKNHLLQRRRYSSFNSMGLRI